MTVLIIMGPRRPDSGQLPPELVQELSGLHVRLEGFPNDSTDSEANGLADIATLRTICQDQLGLCIVAESDELEGSESCPTDPCLIVISQDALVDRAQQGVVPERLPTVVVCREATIELPYSAYRLIDWREHLVAFTPQPVRRNDLARELARSLSRWRELKDHPLEPPKPILPKEPPPSSWPAPVQLWDSSKSDVPMEFLLADDNSTVMSILEKMMTKLGLSYRVARNGKEAVEVYKANPDLCRCILMDISMPVISGLEATIMIREYERERELQPAIIVGLKPGPFLDPLHPGFDFNLAKPIRLEHFRAALSSRGIIPG